MKASTYLLLLCMLILVSSCVEAVGISGGNLLANDLIFQPDSEYHFSYTGVGSKTTVNNYDVYATQLLKEYVVFDTPTHFENVPPGTTIPIKGRIIFPSKMPRPNKWGLNICIMEDCATSGSSACGRTAACAQMVFMVYYDGIYPQSTFRVNDVNRGDDASFVVGVKNVGTDTINSASGSVDVQDIAGSTVGSTPLETKTIKSGQRAQLLGTMSTDNLQPGNYTAFAHLDFDGIKHELNDTFRVGNLTVLIKNYTQEIKSGGIRRFVTTVESGWNDPFDIKGIVTIYDDDRQTLSSVKTASAKLLPWKTTNLEAYIDTTDINPGEYDIELEVQFEGYSKKQEGRLTVLEGVVEEENETAAPTEEKSGMNMTLLTVVLVVIVLMLTFINVLLVLYKRRRE